MKTSEDRAIIHLLSQALRRYVRAFDRLILAAGILFFSGCALSEEHINVAYSAQPGVTKIVRADQVTVLVQVQDQRSSQSHVGHKINGFGMEMAQIIADNDIPSTVQKAVESELTDRGFVIGPGKVQIRITLDKFENHFELGWFSGTATSKVVMGVAVNDASGRLIFSKYVDGEGVNEGIQLAGGENARIALEAGLKDATAKLFADQAFLNSLFEAAKSPGRIVSPS